MRPWLLVCAALILVPVSCGGSPSHPAGRAAQDVAPTEGFLPPAAPPAGDARQEAANKNAAVPAKGAAAPEQPRDGRAARKIVYNADVALVVGSLDKAEADLRALVEDTGGFVASSEILGSAGSPRS